MVRLGEQIDSVEDLKLSTISPGDVFLGEMQGVDHLKFFVVAGISYNRILACSVIINSEINQFIRKRQRLLERQILIKADDYNFLSHDSYINCAQPFKSEMGMFAKSSFKYKGKLKASHLDDVIQFLISSGQLTEEELKIYFK